MYAVFCQIIEELHHQRSQFAQYVLLLFVQDEVHRCLSACLPVWQLQHIRGGLDHHSGVW